MSVLIPKGFYRIACSEMGAKAEMFWNPARRLLLIKVTLGDKENLIGPFDNGAELAAVHHVLTDVKEMKGIYGAC